MRAETFADLVVGRLCAGSRIEAALARCGVRQLANDAGVSVKQFGEMVVNCVPEALDVWIARRITEQWLQAQRQPGPWELALTLDTTARLDTRGPGGRFIGIFLEFRVGLSQKGSQIELFSNSKVLQVGNGQALRAQWTLGVGTKRDEAVEFAAGMGDFHLVPHRLPLHQQEIDNLNAWTQLTP